MNQTEHGHDMPMKIYWAVLGIRYSGASPTCDGCGPDNIEPPPPPPPPPLAASPMVAGDMPPTIPPDAGSHMGYALQGAWAKEMNNDLLGAKMFRTVADANAWIVNVYGNPNHKAEAFFAKYTYVVAVPVKISTAFWDE